MTSQLHVCSISESWYVAEIRLGNLAKVKQTSSAVQTFIILDRSGSMGDVFTNVVNKLLPKVLIQMKYGPQDPITLITFESRQEVINTTVEELSRLPIYATGGTYMAGVFHMLQARMDDRQAAYRILAISDGDLYDQEASVQNSLALSEVVRANGLRVNAQAVRYFTSGCQPDTRGLASILQLNTLSHPSLVDLQTHSDLDTEAAVIAALFEGDGVGSCVSLEAANPCFLRNPWETDGVSELTLASTSKPLVWMQAIPESPRIGGIPMEIVHGDKLTLENSAFIDKAIRAYVQTLKVCQVVGNDQLAASISQYLHRLEKALEANCTADGPSPPDPLLAGRLAQLRKTLLRRQKSMFCELAQLQNQNKVSQLNSLQQANYLRTVQQSKNARGLAQIALGGETDFSAAVQREIEGMAAHLHELEDIDDSHHHRSFFCQGTTLEGIRSVCQLITDGLLSACDFTDVLTMFNIVGLACHTPYGDYPDPMCWRAHDLFPCFVSVADIIMAKSMAGSYLKPPGIQGSEITNVIPVTDDARVHDFLLRHAPTTLELVSGYGMRQILAVVPHTYSYTICGGIWKLVEEIHATNLQFHREQLQGLLEPYVNATRGFFDHIIPFLTSQPSGQLSFFLGNNGATNLIAPLIKLHRQCGQYPPHLPAIMRALYSFEVYQKTKKWHKDETRVESTRKNLYELLNIDLTQHATPVGELFEEEPTDPVHFNGYTPNFQLVKSYAPAFERLAPLALLPGLLADPLNAPANCDASAIYGLEDMTFEEFHFYSIVQSLLFGDKAHRVGDQVMLINDMGIKECAHEMCTSYVAAQYATQYALQVRAKKQEELRVISERLVDAMLKTQKMAQFTELFSCGLTIGAVNHRIQNTSSCGYQQLLQQLLSTEKTVPRQLAKLRCLVTGRDASGNAVWNNGSCIYVRMDQVEAVYRHFKKVEAFEALSKYYEENRLHHYREGPPNRHTHCDNKPSYWAFGFQTIEIFQKEVGADRWALYCSIHRGCCGLAA